MRSVLGRRQVLQGVAALAGSALLTGCNRSLLPWTAGPRITRVGYLGGGTTGPYPMLLGVFRDSMRELGYVEGTTLSLENRFVDGALERAPLFAAELVALKPDVILGNGLAQVEALKRATSEIPIVGVPLGGDPVGTGVVASLARPSGNVTGLSTVANDTVAKRLQILREVKPDLDRVAVLWNANNGSKVSEHREAQGAAGSLGLRLHSAEVRVASDLDGAFQSIASSSAEALLVLADPLVNGYGAKIAAFAQDRRILSMSELRDATAAGGLMNYGPNLRELFQRSAIYVDKIVKGTSPAVIPVEQPTVFDLVVNLKTAEAIGVTIPPSVLQQASDLLR